LTKKTRRLVIRLSEEMMNSIELLAELSGTSKSEVVRYAIVFTRVLHDPSLKLRDALKSFIVDLLKKYPDVALGVPLIDAIKPLKELVEIVGPPELEE
jgi:hypothetical protein